MASLFRPRRRLPEEEEERGAGGKTVRGRRRAAPATPYQRPPPPQQSPPPALPSPAGQRNPSWLSGLISGAGKLISAVLWSPSSASGHSSSSSDDEEEIISNSNEDGETDASSEELPEINQGGKKLQLVRGEVQTSSAIVLKSESKIAIEQLLMQETFSRDECTKLTEILKSRVVDYPSADHGGNGAQKEIPQSTVHSAIPYSLNNLNAISPGHSSFQARTPDLRATAVMEAKKWLEEKKSTSSSDTYLNYGPCTLNTDMLYYGIENGAGSPVDMAKSYMHSLPPWQSPSLHSIGFKTPQPSGMHIYKDEMTYQTTSYSLPSSNVLKRNHHEIETLDTNDEIRRVRVKSVDDISESFNYRQVDPSTSLLENKSPLISSEAERIELHAEDQCTNGALSSPVEEATAGDNTINTGSDPSNGVTTEPGEAANGDRPICESLKRTISVTSHSEKGSETEFPDPVHVLDGNQKDAQEPLQTAEQISSFSVPNESLVLASSPANHDGDPLSEANIVPSKEIKSATPSDADFGVNHHMHSPTKQRDSGEEGRPQADELATDLGGYQLSGARDQDRNAENQEVSEVLRSKIAANGAQEDTDTNSDVNNSSKGEPSPTSSNTSSNPATPVAKRTRETAADIHAYSMNTRAGKSQNGRRIKSIERMLTETQAGPSRRGRKVAVRAKRGRGRGRVKTPR